MTFSLRPFLVTFLVLLQCIAPLVHAHTSEKVLSQGLHIPGLEVYSRSVSFNSTVSVTATLCHVSAFCSDIDGQIVGVDTGFSREVAMQRLYKILADLHPSYYLPAHTIVFKPVNFTFVPISPRLSVPLVCQLAYSAHSPRAPPLHV